MKKQKESFKRNDFNTLLFLKKKCSMKIMLLALPTIVLFSCSSKIESETTEDTTLPIISLNKMDTLTFKEYPAVIEGVMDIEVRSRVDGHLIQLFVDEGAYVRKGDPLFKIDDLPYIEQYNEANAHLSEAENTLSKAKLELDRLIPLIENKISSDYELKIAETNYKIAQNKVVQAKSTAKIAKINVDFTTIKAPISGYIGRIPRKIGSLINRNDLATLTSISNVDQIFVYFSLSEMDFIQFKDTYEGNTVADKMKQIPSVSLILADNVSYGENGRIDMINGQFDKTTGSITLRAIFPNSKTLIRSGNTGKIQMKINHQDVFSVPQSATVDIQDKTFIYVVDEQNKVHTQAIQILANIGNNYLFKTNLSIGNRIVTKGMDALSDGDIINPIEQK